MVAPVWPERAVAKPPMFATQAQRKRLRTLLHTSCSPLLAGSQGIASKISRAIPVINNYLRQTLERRVWRFAKSGELRIRAGCGEKRQVPQFEVSDCRFPVIFHADATVYLSCPQCTGQFG